MNEIRINGEVVSKKELISRYIRLFPDVTPKEIVKKIHKEHGVTVGESTTRNIFTDFRKTSPGLFVNRPAPVIKPPVSDGVTHLKQAIEILGKETVIQILSIN